MSVASRSGARAREAVQAAAVQVAAVQAGMNGGWGRIEWGYNPVAINYSIRTATYLLLVLRAPGA